LDLIPDPVVIVRSDGKLHDLNVEFVKFAGEARDILLKKNIADIETVRPLENKILGAISTRNSAFEQSFCGNGRYEVFIQPFESEDGVAFVSVIFKDISNFVNLEKELLKRNKELMIINTLSGTFISSSNMDLVIENLMRKILLVTDFGIGILMIREDHFFRAKSCSGISLESHRAIQEGSLDLFCAGLSGKGEMLHVVESSMLMQNDTLRREGITFMAAVPLSTDEEIIGFLLLARRGGKGKRLDFDFIALLQLLGNHLSMIIDKIRLFQETQRMSITDGLTGLYNTRFLYKQLDIEIARSNRYENTFSVILFDIDNFKKLNDTYGHQAGDDVLHELAGILSEVSRETDIVVRYGGEEFIVILPNTYEAAAVNLADRTRAAVGGHIFLADSAGGMQITLSGGIASYPQNGAEARSLLNAADSAL
jgi:diguanylate cyclase (GGDEF)-like protein